MPKVITCPECGKTFTCNPEGECWCKSYPPMNIPEDMRGDTCLCRCVLDKLRKAQETSKDPDGNPD